ncbi:hypothetical protein K5D44_01890 [Pseudomonas cichorii]|nr:hypothetical protein [Pseudomonas cichorii]MBX8563426.1 hypothetical protein [Pseudomonas cichorii]
MNRKKLVIDTNLLLLLVIGAVEEGRHIRSSKRLNKFAIKDYDVIREFMSGYEGICITQYIATEVSNLIDLTGHARDLAYEIARLLFIQFEEIDTSIKQDTGTAHFITYGITDSSLVALASRYSILTDDNRLLGPLFEAGQEYVIPFELLKATQNLQRL